MKFCSEVAAVWVRTVSHREWGSAVWSSSCSGAATRGEADPGDEQFAGFARRAAVPARGDHLDLVTGDGVADGHLPYVVVGAGLDEVAGRVDGGLGRTVEVVSDGWPTRPGVHRVGPAGFEPAGRRFGGLVSRFR
jgi:hypothetical protein